jgi:hypothetical protein
MKYIANCSEIINWDHVIDSVKDLNPAAGVGDPSAYDISLSIEENERIAITRYKEQKAVYFGNMYKNKDYEFVKKLEIQTNRVLEDWISAGYKYSEIDWGDYRYEEFELVKQLGDRFAKIVNVTPIPYRVSITRLHPGKFAPWHYDVLPDVSDYDGLGEHVRFVCFMQDPVPGQTLSFRNETFFKEKKGDIWEWDSVKAYHSAANSSLQDYYLFHFQGYR